MANLKIKVKSIRFVDQSQIDFGMLFSPISVKYDSYDAIGIKYGGDMGQNTQKFELDLSCLEKFEIVNYNGNMINEYSLS